MNSSILVDIRDRLESLSRSERAVGEWLLANSRQAIDLSLGEVAAAVSVSDPTVIRFCRSMGLRGFRDLRTELITALQQPESYFHAGVTSADSPADASIKVLESSIQALVELRSSISRMPFDEALAALGEARQIVFVGLGASGLVARDACHKFFRLGIPCTTALDTPTIIQQASIAEGHDVFIAISHTGQWSDLVQGMKLARDRGAMVIAVTDRNSRLADVASVTFHCHPREDTNIYTPMSSRLAQLTVLDALQVSLAIHAGEEAEQKLKQTKEALTSNIKRGWNDIS
ncbi:MAG: SIS domain-containing protein [Pseudomonadales bacterium]|nr:SIS domain-containing protein [Pseudomonadales bacterium]